MIRRLPALDHALPIGRALTVDLPGHFAGKRQPEAAMLAIVGKSPAPRRRQGRRCRVARPVGSEGADDTPIAIETELDLACRFAGARAER